MKKGLRFIIALLTLGSLGICFLPVLTLMGIEISIADVFMTGINYYDRNSLKGIMCAAAQPYVEPYTWIIAAAAGIILLEAILAAALRKKAAYGMGIIISLVNIGAFAAMYVILYNKFDEIEKLFSLTRMNGVISISYVSLYAWIAVYALIFLLSVIGLILWREPKKADREELYLEQIRRAEAERAREPKTDDAVGSFTGALVRAGGRYAGKTCPLADRKKFFVSLKEGEAEITSYQENGAAAGISYIEERGEYCMEPFESNMVFLESGQPLGKGRQYHLPRGTKLYISTKRNTFTLV